MTQDSAADPVKNTLVMVLAGGEGERLYPLTKDRAKPAVPFAGAYRIIDFSLSNCLNSGLRRAYVLTQYKSESLDRHIRFGWNIFNPEIGEWIETRPPQQRLSSDWYQGTADAIYQNIHTLERERPERVLVLSGDHVYRMDYAPMLRAHARAGADVTLACIPRPVREAAGELGVVDADDELRVTGFHEKPAQPPPMAGGGDTCLCSMGIYAFETETLVRRLIEAAKGEGKCDFARDVLPAMVQKDDHVLAFPFTGSYWRDIGTLDAYWEAHMDLVSVQPAFNLYDEDWPIRGLARPQAPAKIVFGGGSPDTPKAEVYNSLVCSGAIISGAYVCDSVVGPDVHIEVGSRVTQSVLLEGVRVGRNATISKAIIDKHNCVPDNAQMGVDREWDRHHFSVSEGGVAVMPKGLPFPSF
ncbi:MAG: glucose-1-phosphate adenylyltransferase [Planctomycetota bacterium]|jgi:glucose-1-phosphate adenylyltransferase